MVKQCETFDHTADVGLSASADSQAELFEALAEGLVDLICPRQQVAPVKQFDVQVQAEDIESLVVDFLCRIMVIVQTDLFAVASVTVSQASQGAVRAQLMGEPVDPLRHAFNTEVKAVTYHQLRIAEKGDQWTGRVILDI